MKKIILMILTVVITANFLFGCSKTVKQVNVERTESSEESEETTEEATSEEIEYTVDVSEALQTDLESDLTTEKYDVDLTILSSTMVYAEVYNMMITPDDYVGKNIKMRGAFTPFTDETNGQLYFYCLISDATACCAQGIEFVLDGDYNYPADYPEPDTEITVSGIFETYTENNLLYCRLKNAKLIY